MSLLLIMLIMMVLILFWMLLVDQVHLRFVTWWLWYYFVPASDADTSIDISCFSSGPKRPSVLIWYIIEWGGLCFVSSICIITTTNGNDDSTSCIQCYNCLSIQYLLLLLVLIIVHPPVYLLLTLLLFILILILQVTIPKTTLCAISIIIIMIWYWYGIRFSILFSSKFCNKMG